MLVTPSNVCAHFSAKEGSLDTPLFSLRTTLNSGQTFCWRESEPGFWQGWISGYPVTLHQHAEKVFWKSPYLIDVEKIKELLGLNVSLEEVIATFPEDESLAKAVQYARGLRIMRQAPWETTVNFICSSLKQIPHIQQINATLRRNYGEELAPGCWSFPGVERLAQVSEQDLRACKLGFRARHLYRTGQQLIRNEVSLEAVAEMPTSRAREELLKLEGVGEKVANCILLFAYGRSEAFPIDVWVERILRDLYFQRKRRVTAQRLRVFAANYFGPHAGYAQQYLFHWIRTRGKVPGKETIRG